MVDDTRGVAGVTRDTGQLRHRGARTARARHGKAAYEGAVDEDVAEEDRAEEEVSAPAQGQNGRGELGLVFRAGLGDNLRERRRQGWRLAETRRGPDGCDPRGAGMGLPHLQLVWSQRHEAQVESREETGHAQEDNEQENLRGAGQEGGGGVRREGALWPAAALATTRPSLTETPMGMPPLEEEARKEERARRASVPWCTSGEPRQK